MANSKRLEVLITGNAKGAQKAFGELDKSAAKSGKSAESSLSKVQKGLIGFGAGAAVFGAFQAFDDAQKVMAQTEAVLKSTGGAANVTAGEVGNLANALSKKSGVDDEAIQSGENLLLTFKGIRNEAGEGNDVFNQATAAALDMSVAMGTDMKSASMQLGKALNDPVAGLSKLTKVGVTFTEQQKQQIKALSDSGDKLGAQKIILQELNSEFGGSAEAQATALGKAKVSVDNMAESVGGVLAPALELGATALGGLADGFSALPSSVQSATLVAGAGAIAWVKWGDGIRSAAGAAKGGIGALKSASEAIGDIAATRGVSKSAATLEVLKSSLTGMGPAAAAGAVGVGILVAAYIDLTDNGRKAAKAAQELIDAADRSGESLRSAFDDKLAKTIANVTGGFDLSGSGKRLGDNLDQFGVSATALSKALHGTDAEFQAFKATLAGQVGNSREAKLAYGELTRDMDVMRAGAQKADGSQKKLAVTQKELGASATETAGGVDDLSTSTKTAEQRSNEARKSYDDQAGALGQVASKAKDATDRINDFYDAQTAGLDATIGVEQSFDDLTTAFKDNGTTLDVNEQKGRDNLSALVDLKDAALKSAMATREQTGSTAQATEKMNTYRQRLHDAMIQSGFTEDQVAVMIQQMGLTPSQIKTTFKTNATETELRTIAVRRSIEQIPGWKDIYFNALTADAMRQIAILKTQVSSLGGSVLSGTAGAAIQQSQAAHRKDHASGGVARKGSWGLVGERGPELVQWDSTARVYPAAQTKAMLSGDARGMTAAAAPLHLTIQVEGSVVTERKLVEVVRTGLIDIGRRTGRPVLAGLA